MNYLLVRCSNKIIHTVNNLYKGTLKKFKSFLLGSQDLKVNLCGLQQDKCSDGKGKNNVGITGQFPRYSYTVGPYGKGPTGNYTTCTYIASKYTAFSINNDRYLITWP